MDIHKNARSCPAGRELLVRYDSQRGFETGQRRFLRPRVWVYAVLAVIGITVFSFRADPETVASWPGLEFIIPQESVVLESFEDGEFPLFAELDRSSYSEAFSF